MTTSTQPPGGSAPSGGALRPAGIRHRPPQAPGRATVRCVTRLQFLYRKDNPAAVATLARLRRGAGRLAHESPDTWGIDGMEDLAYILAQPAAEPETQESQAPAKFFSPDERRKSERHERAEEEAVHLAVTLWALHQQSVRDANMHEFGWTLGRAVRRLARGKTDAVDSAADTDGSAAGGHRGQSDDELNETLRKRFVRIGTSASFDSLAVRLREMVLLLRNARIPLDYGRLADQLYEWQDDNRRADIRRTWGRDFHLSYERSPSRVGNGASTGDAETPSLARDEYGSYGDDVYDSGE
ncbi:type I-E CRISPR-associated protein Cse2/CasB [Streptomyces sp. H27-D2]|uniref:type I-E CRISPR-associated protein Cse2/CasB n=1 Tax=Streptomyces sp. H27-D2 TaxID=3046304 RepID=UPI002DBD9A18|nr:type I-E CRISPR-associated protein Cse2/CasB [Streptomyces sp. H27-D2]MEC4019755.1 type I-E CRISPR-associated protein Cse2/CasB [Streptomyces sp. H27-D2]